MARKLVSTLLVLGALSAPASTVVADAAPKPWSEPQPGLADRVARSGRLVVHVYVPLCDNDQIACGSTKAGDPDDLDHNLYWGAIFGHRRFFSRAQSKFERVAIERGDGPLLERAVFRRAFDGDRWGRDDDVELYVVLDAYRGDEIDEAVDRFYLEAERGSDVTFEQDGASRTLRVDVVGYAGHNRMMDGKAPPPRSKNPKPIPSFVMACRSSQYFAAPLAERGSSALVMTRDLMAPEGYVVHAIASALAENLPRADVRARAVDAYATWQKIDRKVAGSIFAKP